MSIEEYAQALHDAINALPRSWGEVLGEPRPGAADLADDIAVTVDEIEAGRGAEAYPAFVARWLPEREAA
jgi:hypothetical protein